MAEFTRRFGRFSFSAFNILIVSYCLSGCSTSSQDAPVQDRQQPPSIKLKHHTVAKGETLYSIAWRYGLDYRTLAESNGIPSNYTIFPGQRLSLLAKPRAKYQAPTPHVAVKHTPKPKPATPQKRSKKQTKSTPKPQTVSPANNSFSWQWPANGPLLKGFSSSNGLNKGIDIIGKLGEPVSSAGPGQVVYAGKGLRGYGNLLIIKHNEKYLSAYAHNRKLLVREGESVKAGEQIAEIGSSGTDREKLHFEIRRDGKPVDPLKYLPKR